MDIFAKQERGKKSDRSIPKIADLRSRKKGKRENL